jgi:hypothetical protein
MDGGSSIYASSSSSCSRRAGSWSYNLSTRGVVTALLGHGSGDMGDFALPPPPTPYESPSDRRRALREVNRVTRRVGKDGNRGVRPQYEEGSALGWPLKSGPPPDLDPHNLDPQHRSTKVFARRSLQDSPATMAAKGGSKMELEVVSSQGVQPVDMANLGPTSHGAGLLLASRRSARGKRLGLLGC